jgi:predicted TPR repeat methyltransferase
LSNDDEALIDPREFAADLISKGRASQAAVKLQALLASGRGGILTRIALASAQTAMGDAKAAIATAREAAQLAPDAADAAMAFGDALAADADLTGAIAEYQRATRLSNDAAAPQLAIARLWAEIGEWDKAVAALDRAEALGADGAHIRAQIESGRTAPRHPESFVRHLFDQFSADYDARMLGRLGYAAPAILRDLANMFWGHDPKPRATLDLGCGTGLSGKAFARLAQPLAGVDLSPKMLHAARATGLYETLVEADIETWLMAAAPQSFDTVIAADVFVYLGDLDRVFAGVARVLRPSGEFLFTVERNDAADWGLGERRRYRHGEAYLRRLAHKHGFEPASLIAATLRHDAGEPIEGWAALFVRT